MTVKISQSEFRPNEPQIEIVSEDLSVQTWGAIQVDVLGTSSQFFPASFLLNWGGKRFYIDPVEIGLDAELADIILITHGHEDHFSPADIMKICGQSTHVLFPEKLLSQFRGILPDSILIPLKPDEEKLVQGMTIRTVASYTTDPVFLWLKSHPKSQGNLGFHIQQNGFAVFHPGDTVFLPEHQQLPPTDLVFVPLDEDGGKLTMDASGGGRLVQALAPSIIIPMHFEIHSPSVVKFLELIPEGSQILRMDGESE